MVAAAYFRHRGEHRRKVLTPDSAHGTNPASARMAGFETVTVKSTAAGIVDLDDLRAKLDEQVGVFMITDPNTLGIFDSQVRQIADLIHAARRPDLLGRRQYECHPGHHAPRRFRRRHDALQSAQDVQRSARRRWSGSRSDLRH